MSTPHPNTILFARGTIARLALWPALRLAVHASWGGPASTEKQRWLAGVLVDQFETFVVPPPTGSTAGPGPPRTRSEPPPDDVYVEELLFQIMADEFDVALEDDSAGAVARDIMRIFEAARAGDEMLVKELEAQADIVKGKLPDHTIGSGSEEDDEDDDEVEGEGEEEADGEPIPQLINHSEPRTREEPEVDEDGFTTVKKKGRR